MGSCMSLNYCNRGSRGHSGRRRHRNRRDQVECNGGNGGSVESETAESRQPNNHRSPSFSNITSTNGDNLIEPTSNSYQSTISNSFSTNQRFIPPTGKNKRLKRDYVKYLKQSYEGRVWASSARKMTESQLTAKRDEFWHTAPAFEGKPEIWAALKASVDALETRNYLLAQAIIDSANIILPNGIINDCYDELGNRYQLPMYVLLKPTNLGHNASNEQNSNDFESESSTSKAEKPANNERSKKKKKNKGNQSSDDNDENFDDYINCDQEDSDDPSCYANSQRKGISNKSKKSKIKASTSNQANGSDTIPSNQQQQPKQKTTEQNLQVKFRISSFNQDSSKSDIKMTVSPSESVLSVKKRLNDLYKIEPSSQRFFFAGKMMKDKEKMKSHKLKKNVVIQVIVREKVAASEDAIKEIN